MIILICIVVFLLLWAGNCARYNNPRNSMDRKFIERTDEATRSLLDRRKK